MLRTTLIAALIAVTAPALAQTADPVIEAARNAGKVGEQADGYLGLVSGGDADLKARVDQINIKRKAVYTDLAAKRGVTINEVAAATACQLFRDRVGPGQAYRGENGQWTQRQGSAPVVMPSFCGG
ncbi:DUF1318 domain-containing protein [Hankyongella ginsenosidimutans]|uniref:DUF1318 domain-containing protein n=1 Tax=Hankyongella ginsenosidimutans TaxID=1763828 RepID=A0A4D7C0H2_9SPHN|nr:YdbL family protein [Hankyongella ginsenosidimutans]QCI79214.1 DUF1318 domain-containing protein [Hankyongella ginsenosidimutans]TXG84700.1 MAG: DUF1318 domain-containing protein [Sphingomonadales bacterium]